MARPMPLEAPVTRAARSGMGANQSRPGLLSVAMPLVIIAVLAVVLAAAALVFDGGDEGTRRGAAAAGAARADRRARRAGARAAVPRRCRDPLVVTPRQAQDEALESFDEDYPPARRRADEQVLGLLGLLPPGTDLRKVAESTYGEAVAGYYDPRSGRLRVVRGRADRQPRALRDDARARARPRARGPAVRSSTRTRSPGATTPSLAYTALVEGSASALMYRYVDDRFGDEETFGGLAASAFAPTGRPAAVPDGAARVPVHAGGDVREPAARARRRRLVGRRHGAARPAAGLDRAGHAPAGLHRRRPAAARADRAARRRLARAARRDAGGVDDRQAARARRRHGLDRGGGGLGRRPLRAARPRGRARAGGPLGLGHAAATSASSCPRCATGSAEGKPDSSAAAISRVRRRRDAGDRAGRRAGAGTRAGRASSRRPARD